MQLIPTHSVIKTLFRSGLAAAAVVVAAFAHAQAAALVPAAAPHHVRAHALQQARRAVISHRLGLSDDQRAKMKAIHAQTGEAVKAIKANTALTPAQQQQQIAVLRQSARTQAKALLTPEQQGRLAEIMSHPGLVRMAAMQHLRAEQTMKQLALTPGQRTQIRELRRQTVAAVKPIRADTTLTPEQKRERIRAIVQASRTQMRSVLTPDQQQKLDAIRQRLLAPLGPFN